MQDRPDLSSDLEALSTATANLVGTAYFEALVTQICAVAGVDYAHIGELDRVEKRVQTLAACDRGRIIDNIVYDLAGTPCEEATAHEYCVYENRITELFPDDEALAQMGFVSYAGYALTSSRGEVIGLLAVLDREPFRGPDTLFSVLRFVAARTAAELERMQTERTTQDALQAAERALRARDEFLGSVTHELRTPLNAILGFSDLLRRPGDTPEKRAEYAAYIHEAGSALLEMVEDILDFTNVQAGRVTTRVDDVAIRDVVDEAVEIARRRISMREVAVQSVCPAPMVFPVDRRMARRMLVSLLTNAIRHSPPEAPISVECARDEAAEEYRITVSDEGPGMTDTELATALEPFGRNREAVAMAVPGIGMGLPLTAALMKAHGGRLEMDSAPGRGTRATLVFPLPAD